jgi:hypothetical protein
MTAWNTEIRELAHRESAGIQVTLLWQSLKNRISVRVHDARTDEAFQFEVASGDALDASEHPFAYAERAIGWVALPAPALQP